MGEVTHAKELITEFHAQRCSKERICIWALQVQEDPKEGILLQAKLAPTRNAFPKDPRTHPTVTSCFTTAPNPSSNQVTPRTCDYGNLSHDLSRDLSCDLSVTNMSYDLTACDPGNITHDLPRAWSSNMSQDQIRFGHVTHPLINHGRLWEESTNTYLLINQQRCNSLGQCPKKSHEIICSMPQSPITCNCTYPKLRTDHPVLVYKTYESEWTVLRLFSCLPPSHWIPSPLLCPPLPLLS